MMRSVSDRVQVLNYSSVFRRQFPPTPNIRPAARHRQSTGTSGKWNIANEPFAAETCLECLSAQTSWLRKSSSLHLNSIWRIIFVEISYSIGILFWCTQTGVYENLRQSWRTETILRICSKFDLYVRVHLLAFTRTAQTVILISLIVFWCTSKIIVYMEKCLVLYSVSQF